MKNLIFIISILISLATFAGGGSSVGSANPAAQNCLKLGGTLERVQTPEGERGNCVIEEWLLFREMHNRGLVKRHDCGFASIPNPAAVNCRDIGGEIRIVETSAGQAGYCVVDEWKLFRAIDVITKP